jgi:hypothetical protein
MVYIKIAEFVSFSGLGMMTLGMFLTNLMFRRMSWELDPSKLTMRGALYSFWITSEQSRLVLREHALRHPGSKTLKVYKVASASAISGCVVCLLSLTICVLYLYTLRGF